MTGLIAVGYLIGWVSVLRQLPLPLFASAHTMPTICSSALHKKISIGYSTSRMHLPELLPVKFSHKTHTHLVFLNLFWLHIERA